MPRSLLSIALFSFLTLCASHALGEEIEIDRKAGWLVVNKQSAFDDNSEILAIKEAPGGLFPVGDFFSDSAMSLVCRKSKDGAGYAVGFVFPRDIASKTIEYRLDKEKPQTARGEPAEERKLFIVGEPKKLTRALISKNQLAVRAYDAKGLPMEAVYDISRMIEGAEDVFAMCGFKDWLPKERGGDGGQ